MREVLQHVDAGEPRRRIGREHAAHARPASASLKRLRPSGDRSIAAMMIGARDEHAVEIAPRARGCATVGGDSQRIATGDQAVAVGARARARSSATCAGCCRSKRSCAAVRVARGGIDLEATQDDLLQPRRHVLVPPAAAGTDRATAGAAIRLRAAARRTVARRWRGNTAPRRARRCRCADRCASRSTCSGAT